MTGQFPNIGLHVISLFFITSMRISVAALEHARQAFLTWPFHLWIFRWVSAKLMSHYTHYLFALLGP